MLTATARRGRLGARRGRPGARRGRLGARRGRLCARRGRLCARAAALLGLPAVLVGLAALPARADAVRNSEMAVLDAINVPQAWTVTKGGHAVVAVIDSGVYQRVSDLEGSVTHSQNFSGVNTRPSNPNWGQHGTWMASLIAGRGNGPGDQDGIIGVAPQAKLLSVRVITDRSDPDYGQYERESPNKAAAELAAGINYAVRQGASVISMSLGYNLTSLAVRSALQEAYDHNVVVVASAGNSGTAQGADNTGLAPYSYPANYPGVLGVAAVGQDGQAASFSSENLSVQVAAPGVNVPAQGRDGQYWLVSGTSPAGALTAGVAALIKSKYPRLSDAEVEKAITSTTTDRPTGNYDRQVGFGTVDAYAALTKAGRLARQTSLGTVAADRQSDAHFGGGPGAVPAPPVRPRGSGALVLFCLLGFCCLVIVGLCTRRLLGLGGTTARRPPHAAQPPGYPGAPPAPRSGWYSPPAGRHAAPPDRRPGEEG